MSVRAFVAAIGMALSLIATSAAAVPLDRPAPIVLTPDVPVATFNFAVRIKPQQHRLEGQGTVDVPASSKARDVLELELRKEFSLSRVMIAADARRAAPAKLSRIKRGDQFIWRVRPARPIRAGERVRLQVIFAGGRAEAGRFLYIGPEVSFANASRESWLPRPVGLALVGKLQFTVPPGLTVAAMGLRTSTAKQEHAGTFTFTSRVPGDPWFAAGRYTVVRRAGPFPAAVYLLNARPGMESYADGCVRIIDVLSRQFGGYSYGTFSLVELPAEITAKAGGFNALGSPGAILTQGGALDAPFNLAYFGHEIGHQWWGNVVTRDSADGRGDYMMDEALADLGSLLAVEAIEGPESGERYRRTGYAGFNPDTYSGLGYLKLAAAGLDTPLADLPDSDVSFRLARSKGGRVWYALAREIGRERFAAVATAVVRKHAFRPVTWTAFLQSINHAAGRDLSWFYKENFDRTGAPDWAIAWRDAGPGNFELTITQPLPTYSGRLPIEIVAGGQRISREIIIDGAQTKAVIPLRAPVQRVLIDPEFSRIHWTPEYKAEATALAGYTRGRMAGSDDEKLRVLEAALGNIASPDTYAVRYQIHALMGAVLAEAKSWQKARVRLEAAIASSPKLPERLPLTYLRLAKVAKALGDDALLRRAVAGAIATDAAVQNSTGAADQARQLLGNPHP